MEANSGIFIYKKERSKSSAQQMDWLYARYKPAVNLAFFTGYAHNTYKASAPLAPANS